MIRARDTVQETHHSLGLSVTVIMLLAAIAAIRVPLHDLGIIQEGSVIAALLVFVPLAIWVMVVLSQRVQNPFLTLVVVGLAYGVMLAAGHQMFWQTAFGGNVPSLGGNLEGVLTSTQEAVIFRVFGFFSSIVTGTVVGVVVGLSWPGRSSACGVTEDCAKPLGFATWIMGAGALVLCWSSWTAGP